MNQQIRQEFQTELNKAYRGNKKMVDYCMSSAQVVVKTEAGYFIEIEKPSIQKHFCFGESGYDMKEAQESAHVARTSEDYFIRENLDPIYHTIKTIADVNNSLYASRSYDGTNIKHLVISEPWRIPYGPYASEQKMGYLKELTENDRQAILEAYRKVYGAFEKRIKSYLKRYGLSKVRAWTYWRDA